MNDFTPYRIFYIDNIKVTALGDLDKELGDEIRALKRKDIDIPLKIFNKIKCYIDTNNKRFDVVIYIPSNKNNNVMSYFADYISNNFNIEKYDCIKIIKNIKEQKFLNTLEERKNNIQNAFEILDTQKFKNKNILLIDDVYASGETLKEIIKILNKLEFDYYLECLVFCYRNFYNNLE